MKPVHFLGSIERQPTESVETIDRRAQGDRAAKRLFGAPRSRTMQLATNNNIGDAACGVFCEPQIGAKTTDAEVILGEWDSLSGGNIFFTKNVAKVTCSKCLSAMPKRRAS